MKAKFGLDKKVDPSQMASTLNQRYRDLTETVDADFEEN